METRNMISNLTEAMEEQLSYTDAPAKEEEGVISDELFRIMHIINIVILCQAFDIFGTIANVLNMIVFVKIGFADTINISLFALAFCDFCACFLLIWHTIAMNPWFQELNLPFDPMTISYVTACWPHVYFTRMTTVLTAFISFERCLCVIVPLKVKTLITRKVVITVVVCTFLFGMGNFAILANTNGYAWLTDPLTNKSYIGLVFSENREEIESIFIPVLNIVFQFICFSVIVVCTVLLAISLRRSSKWKQQITSTASTTNTEKTQNVSSKEMKVAKMVVMISTMFLICFFPDVFIIQMSMAADRSITIGGVNQKLLYLFASVSFLLESINSSCNIFIYYRNSSNYRATFDQIFCSKKSKK